MKTRLLNVLCTLEVSFHKCQGVPFLCTFTVDVVTT